MKISANIIISKIPKIEKRRVIHVDIGNVSDYNKISNMVKKLNDSE